MALAEQQERLGRVLWEKYQVVSRIGGGGMSQVYLARHRVHGGLFAIKVLAEHLADDPNTVLRFTHEARMAASLSSHPNIVQIFDCGEGDGLYFLVMQFIIGEDMASYLRREGHIPVGEATNLIAQATEALSCAEAKRIVHRDLKPGNMLLDESGRIKLLDFGISRINDFSDGLTLPGESLGTPYYMSPEQIQGRTCDTRSDLYSLGIVFFELLCGRRPFDQQTASAIQMAHLTIPPPSLLSIDPALPPEWDQVVQKLIAKEPKDRYQSTAELLQVLVSRRVSTGPGGLRPSVNPGLRQSINRAQSMPLSKPTPSNGIGPILAKSRADREIPDYPGEGQGAEAPPRYVSSLADSGEQTPRRGMWIKLSILLLLIGTAGAFWLFRSGSLTAHDVNHTAGHTAIAIPEVFSDVHGRMVLVPAGLFSFGSGATQHGITLPAFYIDETEVSNAEYRRFSESTGHQPPATEDYDTHPGNPVSGVSYADATAYAAWAGRRLPTEEEWEKAARGTDGRTYPWGNTPWNDDVPNQLQPVFSEPLRRSPYGAYNMAGNVWEWTATSFAPSPSDDSQMKRLLNGQHYSSEWRITKGGSFNTGSRDEFDVSKSRGLPTDARSRWVGFRCVRNAPST